MRLTDSVRDKLVRKAGKSQCQYKVSAVAFDSKGRVIGSSVNGRSKWNVMEKVDGGRKGTAIHAEASLMSRYQHNVKTIVICRVGRGGVLRPIDPCPACAKMARKFGVKIISVEGENHNDGHTE